MSDTRPDMPRPGRHHLRDDDPRQGQPLRPHAPAPDRRTATSRPRPAAPPRRPPPPARRRRFSRRDMAGAVLGVLLLLGGGFSVWSNRQQDLCQAEQAQALTAVQENIQARSSITQQQTDVDRRLVRELIITSDRDAQGKADARRRWLRDSDGLAAQRADRPYPEVVSCQD